MSKKRIGDALADGGALETLAILLSEKAGYLAGLLISACRKARPPSREGTSASGQLANRSGAFLVSPDDFCIADAQLASIMEELGLRAVLDPGCPTYEDIGAAVEADTKAA